MMCMQGTAGVTGLGRRWRACEAPETLYSRRHWHHLPLALAGGAVALSQFIPEQAALGRPPAG